MFWNKETSEILNDPNSNLSGLAIANVLGSELLRLKTV